MSALRGGLSITRFPSDRPACLPGVRYDFQLVEVPSWCCGSTLRTSFPNNISRNLGVLLKAAWSADMTSRGYTQLATDDVGLGDGTPPRWREAAVASPQAQRCVRSAGFDVSFTIPFPREHVFKELILFNNPLGADNSDITFTSDGTALSPDALVSLGTKRMASFSRDEYAPLPWPHAPSPDHRSRVLTHRACRGGAVLASCAHVFVCRCRYAGHTVSECVDLIPGTFIKWRQLESHKRGMQLMGDGVTAPLLALGLVVVVGGGGQRARVQGER